jgi:beta-mannosidase
LVDLNGTVVAEAAEGELAAPLDAFAHDVFLLDLGANSYVMTRTEDLAPLLDLPPATVVVERAPSNRLLLGNRGSVAALGLVLEDARPYDAPGWVTFSDNVLDLLPGETRELELGGPVGELRVEGWNASA